MIPTWYHRPLTAGCRGLDVSALQRRLGMVMTGTVDEETAVRLRGVQVFYHLPVTGDCDEATASAIGDTARHEAGLPPSWYGTERQAERVVELVGDEDAVRRFQSSMGIRPSGVVDERTALLIGE